MNGVEREALIKRLEKVIETAVDDSIMVDNLRSVDDAMSDELGRAQAEAEAVRDLVIAALRSPFLGGGFVPIADLEAAWRVGAEYMGRADAAEKALARVGGLRGEPSDAQVEAAAGALYELEPLGSLAGPRDWAKTRSRRQLNGWFGPKQPS